MRRCARRPLSPGRPEATLRKAAGFFIEQVLLSQGADHYRVLGGSRETSDANLRRHMALIMRWLHPDVVSGGGSATDYFDRRLYAERVTGAWEGIKTKERRAVYDASFRAVERAYPRDPNLCSSLLCSIMQ